MHKQNLTHSELYLLTTILLLHKEIRWLSRGKVLHHFLALLTEIKAFMEARNEDTTLLSDTEWLLDLAFLADMTEKLNNLN